MTSEQTRKEFIKAFEKMQGRLNAWQVWQYTIYGIACAISNSIDVSKEHYQKREEEFKQYANALGDDGMNEMAKMLSLIVNALEQNPNQDFLGSIFMELGLGSNWHGQFFTPYSVCEMMAKIDFEKDAVEKHFESKSYISCCDPACGAGATLIASANELKKNGVNYQQNALFIGQDIDRTAGMMCYIQMSLLGMPGYVCIANTLSNPLTGPLLVPNEKEEQEIWFTPMYYSDLWQIRKMGFIMGNLNESKPIKTSHNAQNDIIGVTETVKPTDEPKEEKELSEGQLSIFDFIGE